MMREYVDVGKKHLKRREKIVLKRDYWKALLISLVISIASCVGTGEGGAGRSSYQFGKNDKPFSISLFWTCLS
jgi:hypothetical protein